MSEFPDPATPDDPAPHIELQKIRYQAEINEVADLRKEAVERQRALEKAAWDADHTRDGAYQQAFLDVAKGGLDRAKGRAEIIEKAAASIGVIYTGLLALSFSVTENPLPLRAAIPALLLGLAIIFAMIYLSYLTRPDDLRQPTPTSSFRDNQMRRVDFFILWIQESIHDRAYFLRAGVLSLGFAVLFLPAPFVQLPDDNPPPANEVQWPTDVPNTGTTELDQILFQAQVTEVAEERSKPTPAGEDERIWLLLGAALVAILVIPFMFEGGVRLPRSGEQISLSEDSA